MIAIFIAISLSVLIASITLLGVLRSSHDNIERREEEL